MDIPPAILEDILQNITKMKKFFKETPPFTITRDECKSYLSTLFGCTKEYELGYEDKIKSVWRDDMKDWKQFQVRLYFPIEGISLVCSLDKGLELLPISIFLEGAMIEKSIKISFYKPDLKIIMDGPYIICTTLKTDMIVLKNGKTLKQKIADDTTIYGLT